MKEVVRETGDFYSSVMGKESLQSVVRLSKRIEEEGGEGVVISQENKCRKGREHRQLQLVARLCSELGCWTATV